MFVRTAKSPISYPTVFRQCKHTQTGRQFEGWHGFPYPFEGLCYPCLNPLMKLAFSCTSDVDSTDVMIVRIDKFEDVPRNFGYVVVIVVYLDCNPVTVVPPSMDLEKYKSTFPDFSSPSPCNQ